MRKLAWIILNRDADQFILIKTYVTIASYNVSVFAMNVAHNLLQKVFANSFFCYKDPKTTKINGA